MMRRTLQALLATLVLALITGLIYPLAMTAIGQSVFRGKADGSIVSEGGKPVGSELIGQQWSGPAWFYGRPSAISSPYDASTSYGSNLGPNSGTLANEISQRVSAIRKIEGPYHPGLTAAQIPVDLLTASGSGLDPNISPQAAYFQAPRIAAVRHISISTVDALIRRYTQGPALGFLGESRVNVLELNLALARTGG